MQRPKRLIHINGKPYLERTYLGTLFGVTFFLHRFLSSDPERHLHNHPWTWGAALVLRGGYEEEFGADFGPDGLITGTRRVRWFNAIGGPKIHRITSADCGTRTLVAHGPRKTTGWGFFEGCTFNAVEPTDPYWWRDLEFEEDEDGGLYNYEHDVAITEMAAGEAGSLWSVEFGDDRAEIFDDQAAAIRYASNKARGC